MGILDSGMFDPRSYQGLLSALPSLMGGAMPGTMQPGGFPPMPQQQPQPDPAALPQNAQPVQHPPLSMMPQAPQQPEAPQQGFMESMGLGPNALMALGAGIAGGNSLGDSVSKGVGGLVAARQQNQTEAALVKRGLDPQMAKTVASNPAMLNAIIPRLFGATGQTDDIKEYEYAKKEDPGLTFDKFMARKKAVSGEYGMQGYWGTKNGKPALIQLGKSGGAVEAVLPPGFELAKDTIRSEGPTGTTLLDPQTRQVVGFIPKDIAGGKIAEAKGESQGAAQVALPQVLANAEQTLTIIKSIKDDPYRERGTGASSVLNVVPGTGGYDFAQKVEQLKGKTFLEAFQSLKGGGAITEMEGRKAENAIARLSVAQSEGAFMEALNELETVVTAGMERSKRKAGVSTPQAATTTAPNVADLKSKYGLK